MRSGSGRFALRAIAAAVGVAFALGANAQQTQVQAGLERATRTPLEIVWLKAAGAGGSCAWGSWRSAKNPTLRDVHEYVLVAGKGPYRRTRIGEDTISKDEFLEATTSVWTIAPASARRIGHPAPFPVELPRRLIGLYTFRGDLVLDPFMGAGSTAVAAVETGRHFVGYDIHEGYLDIARTRVASVRGIRG